MSVADESRTVPECEDCSTLPGSVNVDGRVLCDGCADRAIALATGWPQLPEPPPPEVIIGPDGAKHVFRYRIFRWPGRAVALAEEVGREDGGHQLEVGVDHFDDAHRLPNRIRRAARSAVGRKQLIRDEEGRLALEGSEVTGRLEESDSPYECPRVVIDGMMLTWAELGDLLSPHKGWSFHLTLGGDAVITDDARLARTLSMDMGAHRLLERTPPKWFVIALEHYPTPREWRARRRHDGTPTGA